MKTERGDNRRNGILRVIVQNKLGTCGAIKPVN
jgi:hypothetical protein